MKPQNDPRRLHLSSFAQAGGQLLGDERLAHFERLIAETQGVGAETRVHYCAQGEMRLGGDGANQVWLRLTAHAMLALTCQRCLGPGWLLHRTEPAARQRGRDGALLARRAAGHG